jgi:HTH-type transcriptional regulator/antitoxin HipB
MSHTVHTLEQLGPVLKGLRKEQNLTQKEVGAAVGMLPKTISKLELEPGTATVDSLFKLLSALDLEVVLQSRQQDLSARESSSKEW